MDVHCDEIDDEASRGLETVAARALEFGLFDRVTASHTIGMLRFCIPMTNLVSGFDENGVMN